MILYGYWRSSAAYRVRIALNLKGLDCEQKSINLAKGQQHSAEYKQLNPQGLVPILMDGDIQLTQSPAILEYLEEVYPQNPLLPSTPAARAKVRELSSIIGCDMHPLNNLRVLKYLENDLGVSPEAKMDWYFQWLQSGFDTLESQLAHSDSPYCLGDSVTLADVYLMPQLYNARRFNFDHSGYPRVRAVEANCNKLAAFQQAAPEQQEDAS